MTYDIAESCIKPLLPNDQDWQVSFSVREAQFKCHTQVPSAEFKCSDGSPMQLGVCLRFNLTTSNELQATAVTNSKKNTSKSASGQTQASMKLEIMAGIKKSWREHLNRSGIEVKF